MKFTAAIVAFGMTALVAAAPQASESNTITAPPTSAPSVSVDPAYASTLSCVSACGPGNVYCQAECQGLPVPDESAVNATHDCIAACPPGGDDEKNAAWGECQRACVSSNYWTATTPYYTATLPADATRTGDADPTSTDEDGDPSETNGPGASETPNAASLNSANLPFLGVFGLFLGALVL